MSAEKYGTDLWSELRSFTDRVQEVGPDYLAANLALPLSRAVEQSFSDAAGSSLDELFQTLHSLDSDLETLRQMANAREPSRGHYENWAKYWTSVSPGLEVVRMLVREVLLPKLGPVRERLKTFCTALQIRAYVNEGCPTLREGTPQFASDPPRPLAKRVWVVLWRVANLGFRRATFSSCVTHHNFVNCLEKVEVYSEYEGGIQVKKTRRLRFDQDLLVEFELFALRDPLIVNVDTEASRHVPNSSFTGIGTNYASTLRKIFGRQFHNRAAPIVASVNCVSNGWISLSCRLSWIMINAAGLVAGVAVASTLPTPVTWIRAVMGATICLGVDCILALCSKRKLGTEIAKALLDEGQKSLEVTSARCAEDLVSQVNDRLLGEVLKEVQVQLSPRPLQRALTKSLK